MVYVKQGGVFVSNCKDKKKKCKDGCEIVFDADNQKNEKSKKSKKDNK